MTKKRKRDDIPTESKRCKLKSVHPTENRSSNLTDLGDHLLTYILDQLPLDDLSNVSLVNKHFNSLIHKILGDKCINGTATIFITGIGVWFWASGTVGKFIFANSSELCIFLRTSGSLITHLLISCAPNCTTAAYKCVENVIFKYCSDALLKITIETTLLPVMSELIKPFANVKVLEFNECELSANLCQQFKCLFPSLNKLTLKCCKPFDAQCIETDFPSLKDLTLFGRCQNRMVFKSSHIKKCIELNPRIQRLVIDFEPKSNRTVNDGQLDFELDFDFYQCVSKCLSKLKYLKVYGKRKYQPAHYEEKIEFRHLETLEVFNIYNQQPNEITPFTFEHLRELKIEHLQRLSTDWINFITENDGLVTLTIDIYGYRCTANGDQIRENINKDQLLTIFKSLKKLKEIHLQAASIVAKDLVACLWKRKSLTSVYLRDYFTIDSIIQTFDQLIAKKPWTVDYNCQNLILKRVVTKH